MTAASKHRSRVSIKAYACTECDKSYDRRDYLRRHQINHDRPNVSCAACGADFRRTDVLKRHMERYCAGAQGVAEKGPRRRRRKRKSPSGTAGTPSDTLDDEAQELGLERSSAPPSSPLRASTDPPQLVDSISFPFAQDTFPQLPHQELPPDTGEIPIATDNSFANTLDMYGAYNDGGQKESVSDLFDWLCAAGQSSSTGDIDMCAPASFPYDSFVSTLAGPSLEIPAKSTLPIPLNGSTPGVHISPTTQDRDTLQSAMNALRTDATLFSLPSAAEQPSVVYHPDPSVWTAPNISTSSPRQDTLSPQAREDLLNLLGAESRAALEPAFPLSQMKICLELYFMQVYSIAMSVADDIPSHATPMYPIVHQASLPYRTLPRHLLLMLIFLGSAHSDDKAAFDAAIQSSRRLRNFVLERVEQESPVAIADLQTILLLDHFCRTYCPLKIHDAAQIYHSPAMSIAQMAGVFMYSPEDRQDRRPVADDVLAWLEWVEEEERIRIGWHAFVLDAQNAALYRTFWHVAFFQSPLTLTLALSQLHCISIDLPFPADERIWEATDVSAWAEEISLVRPAPTFRRALRELIEKGKIPQSPNEQALFIILHGLFSLSLTLRWRDLSRLSLFSEGKLNRWKASLRQSFQVWMEHVESELRGPSFENRSGLQMPVYWAGLVFAHLGTISFDTDTTQLRIAAGAWTIAGRPIAPAEKNRANSYMKHWARSEDGAHAYVAAIRLLNHLLPRSEGERFRVASNFISWAAYIASLVLWAYAYNTEGPGLYHENTSVAPISPHPSDPSTLRIEPYIAVRDAYMFLDRMSKLEDYSIKPVADAKGKNKCAGILAYSAYMAGSMKRGRMEECHGVLMGILATQLRS